MGEARRGPARVGPADGGTPPRGGKGDARTSASLYESDFYGWTREQARLLREGRLDLADLENLAEEIDTLGRSEAAALRSSYRLICMHLLKMLHQPRRATASRENTVHRERLNVETVLADNPGLKGRRASLFGEAYALARREAAFETGLSHEQFATAPPFSLEQVEAATFWPEGFPAHRKGVVR